MINLKSKKVLEYIGYISLILVVFCLVKAMIYLDGKSQYDFYANHTKESSYGEATYEDFIKYYEIYENKTIFKTVTDSVISMYDENSCIVAEVSVYSIRFEWDYMLLSYSDYTKVLKFIKEENKKEEKNNNTKEW